MRSKFRMETRQNLKKIVELLQIRTKSDIGIVEGEEEELKEEYLTEGTSNYNSTRVSGLSRHESSLVQ